MSPSRLWTAMCVLVFLIGFPRTGTAGFWDVIIEMSGPKMYGFSADCRLTLEGKLDSCKPSGPLGLGILGEAVSAPRNPRWWLSFTGGFYFSADATVNQQDYARGEVKMWVFDPMLELESKSWPTKCPSKGDCERLRLQIYHGVLGWSYNRLFGDGFSTFSNSGLKLRPFGIVVPIGKIRRWDFGADFSYDLRLYSRRFTAEDFGRVPLEPEGTGMEPVHALVFGVRIKILPEGTK